MTTIFVLKLGTHFLLHFVFPLLICRIFFREKMWKAYFIMMLSMLIDLDHLVANPIFSPNRNSIGFHFLHTFPMIFLYALGAILLKGNWRIFCIGLVLHILTDLQDYYLWAH